jgi:hypothetical protein
VEAQGFRPGEIEHHQKQLQPRLAGAEARHLLVVFGTTKLMP